MNTSAVAKELGVSTSTIKRWVKQLNLSLQRNDMGHFFYSDEDIQTLVTYQQQQNEALKAYQEIAISREPRQGYTHIAPTTKEERMLERLDALEDMLLSKADQVVTYQLLQHRKEIEELQDCIHSLMNKIDQLEKKQSMTIVSTTESTSEETSLPKRTKKPTLLANVFRMNQKHSS